jgi:hypothetical protein
MSNRMNALVVVGLWLATCVGAWGAVTVIPGGGGGGGGASNAIANLNGLGTNAVLSGLVVSNSFKWGTTNVATAATLQDGTNAAIAKAGADATNYANRIAPPEHGVRMFVDGDTNMAWANFGDRTCIEDSLRVYTVTGTSGGGGMLGSANGGTASMNAGYYANNWRGGLALLATYASNVVSAANMVWGGIGAYPTIFWRTNSYLQTDFRFSTDLSSPLTNTAVAIGLNSTYANTGAAMVDTNGTADGIYLRLSPDVSTNFWAVCKRGGSSNAVEITSVRAYTNTWYSLAIYGSTNWTRLVLNGVNVANFFQKDGTNDFLPTAKALSVGYNLRTARTNGTKADLKFTCEIDYLRFYE